mgnify:CR=1 FL=1
MKLSGGNLSVASRYTMRGWKTRSASRRMGPMKARTGPRPAAPVCRCAAILSVRDVPGQLANGRGTPRCRRASGRHRRSSRRSTKKKSTIGVVVNVCQPVDQRQADRHARGSETCGQREVRRQPVEPSSSGRESRARSRRQVKRLRPTSSPSSGPGRSRMQVSAADLGERLADIQRGAPRRISQPIFERHLRPRSPG